MSAATQVESFSIRSERRGGAQTVCLSGGLDLAGREPLMDELGRLGVDDAKTLILDLRELEFIDSSGIDALVKAKRRWRENGGRLELLCAPGPIQRFLQSCGLDTLLATA